MPLRVAPCPKCQNPLVFGERQCRTCSLTFEYGQPAPPIPTSAQIEEALRAVGLSGPPAIVGDAVGGDIPSEVSEPTASGQPRGGPSALSVPPTAAPVELETGRYEPSIPVAPVQLPGLIDSRLFGAFVPENLAVQQMDAIDRARFEVVEASTSAGSGDVERTEYAPVGEVDVLPLEGIAVAAFEGRVGEVDALALEGLEPTGVAPTAPLSRKPDSGSTARRSDDLPRIICRCSEIHRAARCPMCGTPHPSATGAS